MIVILADSGILAEFWQQQYYKCCA